MEVETAAAAGSGAEGGPIDGPRFARSGFARPFARVGSLCPSRHRRPFATRNAVAAARGPFVPDVTKLGSGLLVAGRG